ncbi:hypothetical protein [Lentilitoribacter sp. Alg239-R112]|uniref:hypothetical protein n=1 Tax=Lentilitoribacter sp. Alg239-R112 TaxID=2305987 RepID=UPI0013A70727|nr:hypothetical protein [Lentilitoribacter sp. Alg239-R112]
MNNENNAKKNQWIEKMMAKRKASFDYKQLAADIRRKKDDYSLIEDNYNGVIDINEPTTVPFRWGQEDVGKEMVIVDEFGLFGHQSVVELTLTYLKDDTIEFAIDKVTLIDTGTDDEPFEIEDQEAFECGGIVRLKRGEIITGEQLGQMSDFVYGHFGAPDHKDFSLYALVQYWAHHHVLVQNLHDVVEKKAQAMLGLEGQIQA